MNLTFITPEYFNSLSTLLVNILVFLTSIASLLLTYLMYKAAIRALTTWKDQDNNKLVIEGISAHSRFLTLYNTLFRNKITLSESEQDRILEEYRYEAIHLIKAKNLKALRLNNSVELSLLEEMMHKTVASLNVDHPIRLFYVRLSSNLNDYYDSLMNLEALIYYKQELIDSLDNSFKDIQEHFNYSIDKESILEKSLTIEDDGSIDNGGLTISETLDFYMDEYIELNKEYSEKNLQISSLKKKLNYTGITKNYNIKDLESSLIKFRDSYSTSF